MKTSNKYLLVAAVATVLSATDSWGMQQFVRTEGMLPTATNPAPTKITLTLQNGEECSFEKGNSEETLAALDKVVTARELPYIASLAIHAARSGASYEKVLETIVPVLPIEFPGRIRFIEKVPAQERLRFCLDAGLSGMAGLTLSDLTLSQKGQDLQKQVELLQQAQPNTELGRRIKDELLEELQLKVALGEKY